MSGYLYTSDVVRWESSVASFCEENSILGSKELDSIIISYQSPISADVLIPLRGRSFGSPVVR